MMTTTQTTRLSPGRKTILAIAVAATLVNGMAVAADKVVSANSSHETWTGDNLTINSGVTVSAGSDRAIHASGPSLGTLNNNGTLISSSTAVYNENGTMAALTNSGSITGYFGILNYGTIGRLDNNGTISSRSGGQAVYNQGHIATLTNNGTINSSVTGIVNQMGGSIGVLENKGLISGSALSILNNNFVGSILNSGTMGNVENKGTISGASTALYNSSTGTMGSLNNSGMISGSSYAISNDGDMGAITNSGTIAGDIYNASSNDLIINGGTGSIFGVLTGYSASVGSQVIGGIVNQNSNVVFNSGNLLLNDNIRADGFTVTNNGNLQINNKISITGDYTQAANAGLVFDVANKATAAGQLSDKGYGRLSVDGAVTLASGTSVGLANTGGGYRFAQGQRYLVITATDGAGSEFNEDTLNYTSPSGVTLNGENVAITGSPNSSGLLLTVIGADGGSNAINGATNSNAQSSLNGLFAYTGTNEQLMNLARAGAALGSDGNNGGAQLSPTATASAASTASVGSTQRVFEVAGSHMDSMRTAQAGNGSSGVATGENSSGKGLWGQAFGGSSRQDEREDIAGYHANYSGMLLGADAELNDSWRAGGLFSYATTSVNNDGVNKHNSADIDSYGLIAYATYTANPWYVNLSAGAVQHQYDTKRQINITGFDGTAKGNYDGMQYLAAAQFGYPIDLGSKTTLTPIAGLAYSTLKQDSYTEKDGNGAALHINSDDVNSLKSDLGAKLERSFSTSYGEVIPVAQLTWRHEFRDEGTRSTSNFAADVSGETAFATKGPTAISDTGALTLGATLIRSNNLSLAAKYTLEAGSGYTANTGNVQARWDF